MKRMLFRLHRGGLAESMATVVELDATVGALMQHLCMSNEPWLGEGKVDLLRMKSTGPDERIGWDDTWLVRIEGFGVVGMTNCLPEDAPDTVHIPVTPPGVLQFRPNDGSRLRSFEGITQLQANMDTLIQHLRLHGMWNGTLYSRLTFHRTKPNRNIGWPEQWSVRNNGIVIGLVDMLPEDVPHECLVPGSEKELEATDLVKASAFEMIPVPQGQSAYNQDLIRSGMGLNADWEVMFEMSKPALEEVVLWNRRTGQRILIKLEALTTKFDNL
ncbi:hypothetical protein D3C85_159280 [compost metagenome]